MVIHSFIVQVTLSLIVFFGVTVFNDQPNFQHFGISIFITVLAALVENLSEPYYVAMLLKMEFS